MKTVKLSFYTTKQTHLQINSQISHPPTDPSIRSTLKIFLLLNYISHDIEFYIFRANSRRHL